MLDLIGTTLGHYRIVERIGAGGMGVVYRAHDERLDRDVAVKVLPEEVAANPTRVARFEREAKAVAKLAHANILAIHEFGADGGVHYAVTELLRGESLRQLLHAAGGPLPWRRVQEIGVAVADGLGAAHGNGVIHRDLKPENIFITSDGRVKILDFGLAQFKEPLDVEGDTATLTPAGTLPGTVLGTVGYMAPEQVRGKPADERSDIFSLGCVLYEMLAGQSAFKRETTAEIMTAILRGEPPSLVASGVEVAPEVERTVERCLEKNPERRFQSARDLAFALGSLTGSSAPVAPVEAEPAKGSRRWPVMAAAVAGLSVVLAVLLVVLILRQPSGVDLSSYRFTPFATDAEAETRGVWSPDGGSIAYGKVVDGRSQISVRGLDADFPVRITDLPDGAWSPFWSSDGSRVWFLSDQGVCSVGSAGGEPGLVQTGDVRAAALSPDGQTLATWRITVADRVITGSVWLASPPAAEPHRYEPAPFEVEGAPNPVFLRFSPNGKQILASFASSRGPQMWLLPLRNGGAIRGEPRRIFSDFPGTFPPSISWMPDGRRVVVAFQPTSAARSSLWMANFREESLIPLTAGITDESLPDVSPDGSRIVFTSGIHDYDLVEVPLDGTPLRDLLATSRREHSAAWVPGQNRYVYMTERSGQTEIRLRSSSGDWDRSVVTEQDFPDGATLWLAAPTVSPDGRLLAFSRRGTTGEAAIWLAPITGGTPTTLVESTGGQYGPAWSPDGRWLSFFWNDGGVYKLAKVRVGGSEGPEELVVGCVNAAVIPAWSPTGEWIAYGYYCDGRAEEGIGLVSLDEGESRVLTEFSPWGFVWSRDGTAIYTTDVWSQNRRLVAVDVNSGTATTVRELGPDVVFSAPVHPGVRFTLAPDGASFAAAVVRERRDLWLLEGFNQRRGLLDRLR